MRLTHAVVEADSTGEFSARRQIARLHYSGRQATRLWSGLPKCFQYLY